MKLVKVQVLPLRIRFGQTCQWLVIVSGKSCYDLHVRSFKEKTEQNLSNDLNQMP